jgi:hypothetical protein
MNTASRPGAITGANFGLCGLQGITYTVTNVSGITYNWTVPGTAGIANGQGTNSITVNYPSTNTAGNVSVTAANACGTSAARSLSMKSVPATPASIAGSAVVCSGSTGNAYSIAPVAFTVNYTWTGPSGSLITGNGVTSANNVLTTTATNVSVDYGTVAATSTLRVRANNNCGSGGTRTMTLSPCSSRMGLDRMFASLYPNPGDGLYNLMLNSVTTEDVNIMVYDLAGRMIYHRTMMLYEGVNELKIDLRELNDGLYFLSAITTQGLEKFVLVKQ